MGDAIDAYRRELLDAQVRGRILVTRVGGDAVSVRNQNAGVLRLTPENGLFPGP